jgi:hypothetical protein
MPVELMKSTPLTSTMMLWESANQLIQRTVSDPRATGRNLVLTGGGQTLPSVQWVVPHIGPPPRPKELTMSVRSKLLAAVLTLASLGAAHADGLRPIEGKSIDLGEVSGVAYYTIESDGFHVVTTLAQGEAGTPVRVVSVLAPGQRVVFSTPHQAGALEISRKDDSVLVRNANGVSN